ncbi:MAG: transcription elongation factor GreB [endosymbiont of Galathealinum brachiosum]|uniref:Transcription elongation factor GreB n=1 Tax=endosymbiont of Galathealinum brachiosum TaxID=2200906 RepID=A0A370D9Y5_9GAMM|nr:MAG: transcription elongation factor GreB [endosymbiont of Galathealinum brachiosum]
MGRYRPPAKKGSPYITAEGMAVLEQELDYLWNKRRPLVVKALSTAAAEGDRSENAEYIYRKKELGEIDRRVRFLSKRVDEVKVVSDTPKKTDQIFFGAWVELEDDEGVKLQYRVVGPDEFDSDKGYISMDSPVATALMKKLEGDDVTITTPGGVINYYINRVQYKPFSS